MCWSSIANSVFRSLVARKISIGDEGGHIDIKLSRPGIKALGCISSTATRAGPVNRTLFATKIFWEGPPEPSGKEFNGIYFGFLGYDADLRVKRFDQERSTDDKEEKESRIHQFGDRIKPVRGDFAVRKLVALRVICPLRKGAL